MTDISIKGTKGTTDVHIQDSPNINAALVKRNVEKILNKETVTPKEFSDIKKALGSTESLKAVISSVTTDIDGDIAHIHSLVDHLDQRDLDISKVASDFTISLIESVLKRISEPQTPLTKTVVGYNKQDLLLSHKDLSSQLNHLKLEMQRLGEIGAKISSDLKSTSEDLANANKLDVKIRLLTDKISKSKDLCEKIKIANPSHPKVVEYDKAIKSLSDIQKEKEQILARRSAMENEYGVIQKKSSELNLVITDISKRLSDLDSLIDRFDHVKDDSNALSVRQGQFKVTTGDNTPLLKTLGLGPCICITMWDPQTKTGLLAHIDSSVDSNPQQHLLRLKNEFSKVSGKANGFEISLIGGLKGDPSSIGIVGAVSDVFRTEIDKTKPENILSTTPRDAIFSLITGEVAVIDKNTIIKNTTDATEQMNIVL